MLFASQGRKVGPAIFDRRHRRLTQGMVGYWSAALTGPTGLQLLDLSGQNNHGTLTNMDAPTDWIPGRHGYALDFDGTDDFVDPANITGIGFGNFTFAAWVRTSVVARRYMIASNLTDLGSEGHWLAFETSNRLYSFFGSEIFATATGITLADDNWHLVGVTRSGTTGTLFADGRQIGSPGAIGGFDAGKGNFRIGARGDSLTQNWQGQMAEIAIWNRAITIAEFSELFRLGPGGLGRSRRIGLGIFEAAIGFSILADTGSYTLSGLPIPLLYGRAIPADTASVLLQGQTTQMLVSRLLGADRGSYDVSGLNAGILLGRLLDAGAAAYTVDGTSAGFLASRRISAESVAYLASGQDAAFLQSRILQAGTGQYILIASPIDIQTGTGGAAPYYYLFLLGGSC